MHDLVYDNAWVDAVWPEREVLLATDPADGAVAAAALHDENVVGLVSPWNEP